MSEKKRSFWDLFTMVENGKLKSTFMLYSFALALLFLAAYGAAFVLLIDPVHSLFAPVSAGLSAVMECLVPALAGSAFAALCQKLARNKRLAPAAYVWLAVATVAIGAFLLCSFDMADWGYILSLILQMAVVPILTGGIWTLLVALRHVRAGK